MIYTITMNPSIDYLLDVESFSEGALNRAWAEKINVGGKGINVSLVLQNLGEQSVALGFLAGFTGDEIERRISLSGVYTDFVHLFAGNSRINMKIRSGRDSSIISETEVNGKGPYVDSNALSELFRKIENLNSRDTLVLSGSIPMGLSDSTYSDIMRSLSGKGVRIVVDATDALLKEAIKEKPFLIKPNLDELSALFGTKITEEEDIITYARTLQLKGARNVLVSLSEKGAILICEDGKIYKSAPPKIKLVSSVGSGDSMIAGFLVGLSLTKNYAEALKWAICTGSASASSENLATRTMVEKYISDFGEILESKYL